LDSLPNDIEPIVEIVEYSLYYLISTTIFLVIFLYFTTKFISKYINFKQNSKKKLISELMNLDLNDSKTSAYRITEIGGELIQLVVGENRRSENLFRELESALEIYKYKKSVPPISNEVRAKLAIFLEVIEHE
jgi:Mn-dependent DtxR family transcriptional regulator